MRYAVTGCAGFIGSHLTEALLAGGHTVIGIDSFQDYYPREWKEANLDRAAGAPGFTLHDADLVAMRDLAARCADLDGVFHLAAQPGVRGSWGASFGRYLQDNVLATQKVLEAAAGLARVVVASSSSVYGDAARFPVSEHAPLGARSPYGVTKEMCERLADVYAASSPLDHVTLRYFTVYGPRQRPDMAMTRIAAHLLDGTAFTMNGDGSQLRDVTHVTDVVAATIAAMTSAPAGEVFNVGGGHETSLREIIGAFEACADRKLAIQPSGTARGDVSRTSADIAKAERLLGWKPAVDLAQGVRGHFAWAAAHPDLLRHASCPG